MPTINEYKDGSGLFILARPSDIGNITYQVTSIAEEILRKLGHEDGDDVDWRTIQALKVAKLVYTGEQGVDDSDEVDFVAEMQDSIEDITEEQARTLLDELRERASLSDSRLEDVEDVLGVRTQTRFERLESNIQ